MSSSDTSLLPYDVEVAPTMRECVNPEVEHRTDSAHSPAAAVARTLAIGQPLAPDAQSEA